MACPRLLSCGSRELPTIGWGPCYFRTRGQDDFDSSTWTTPTFVVQGFPGYPLTIPKETHRKSVWRAFDAGFRRCLALQIRLQRQAMMSTQSNAAEKAAVSVLDRLFAGGRVLCDGAMGTMLCDRGISIDRCLDALN